MKVPSVKEYKSAIENVLIPRQITMLQTLYNFPNATATAKELAYRIHPSNPAQIVATGRIGKTGKRIAEFCGITPDKYYDGKVERPAYFRLISDQYERNVGWTMYKNLQKALEELNLVNKNKKELLERLPTETMPFEDEKLLAEGKVIQVFVNRYERNQTARGQCIAHYGHKCQVCNFDFGEAYGDHADGFIHVHHKKPLAELGQSYNVNPIKDLIPVCANCHSAIHLTKPALTVEELKMMLKKSCR